MKIIVWNVNRATESRRTTWDFLLGEDPDVALLQEVGRIPRSVRERYECYSVSPRYSDRQRARYSNVILSRWETDHTPYLTSELEWVNRVYSQHYGWIIACEVIANTGTRYRVVSVHSEKIHKKMLADVDTSAIRLTNYQQLWTTEILWSLLRNGDLSADTNWIVGGDFNSSVTFDTPKRKWNREIIERLNNLGLTDCLSHFNHGLVPTFQHSSRHVEHQLDYCYVNAPMLERLNRARVPNQEQVFGQTPRLSDHLPIVCEFD